MQNKQQKLSKTPILLVIVALIVICAASGQKARAATEANLKAGPYGPTITVGLKEYSKDDLRDGYIRISANKKFNVKDRDGKIVTTVAANTDLKIRYDRDKYFIVYGPIANKRIYKQITFDSADSNNNNLIFDLNIPGSSYDHYRGKARVRYADIENASDKIWVINILPLEQYVWGMGEMAGTGPSEHSKVMTTIFRTYGYWKIKFSTKWAYLGFKVNTTAGDQIYRGYDWEKGHPNIRKMAEATKGRIVMYKDEIVLAAYHSWNDGKTRRYEDGHWGRSCDKPTGTTSKVYPYLSSIKDPHGKHPTKSTCTLAREGNHMVGLTAHGSLDLAGEHDWSYGKILKYYYLGSTIFQAYK